MVYQLSEQLDDIGNAKYAFDAYREYLKTNKERIPQSVLSIIDSEDWYGGSMSKAPYYCHLESLELRDYGKKTANLTLNLIKRDYREKPFTLKIVYQGLSEFDLPGQHSISDSAHIQRYNEFLFFDPWHRYNINEKMFTHKIEWVDGNVWTISAREIQVDWKEIE